MDLGEARNLRLLELLEIRTGKDHQSIHIPRYSQELWRGNRTVRRGKECRGRASEGRAPPFSNTNEARELSKAPPPPSSSHKKLPGSGLQSRRDCRATETKLPIQSYSTSGLGFQVLPHVALLVASTSLRPVFLPLKPKADYHCKDWNM